MILLLTHLYVALSRPNGQALFEEFAWTWREESHISLINTSKLLTKRERNITPNNLMSNIVLL